MAATRADTMTTVILPSATTPMVRTTRAAFIWIWNLYRNPFEPPMSLFSETRAINADPFFDERVSRPARQAMGPDGTAFSRYRQLLQKLHRTLCYSNELPNAWRTDYCEGRGMTVFRSRRNGRWTTYGLPSKRYPVEPFVVGSAPADERQVAAATAFRNAIGISAECVILTEVPGQSSNLAPLEALSRRTGMPAATSYMAGLTSFDGNHLDPDSAEQWSGGFLNEIQPILDRCLGKR